MTLAMAVVQLMLLVQGQAQTTSTAAAKGGVAPLLGGTGCLEGDEAACTITGCATGIKTCTNHGTWGACVCQPLDCPSTTCRTGAAVFSGGVWSCAYTNAPLNSSCDDTDLCNGHETCDGAGTCRAGTPPVVDDGNPATLDFCGPEGVKHVQIASNGTAKEAFATPMTGPDPRSRALPVAPNAGGPVVDESRGTLNYRYTFQLPAARGRYQPRLDLSYSSSSTYNDASGAGWSLTSFYIEAGPTPPATSASQTEPLRTWQELVAPPIGWWLVADGARMRLLPKPNSGDEWRTEVQGPFVSIKWDINKWIATDAAGTVFSFSRRFPEPAGTPWGRHYLSEVNDVDGNKTAFTYQGESGAAALLTAIDYNFFSGAQTGTSVELTWSPDYQARIQRAGDTVAYRNNILRTVRIKGASTNGKPTLLRHELSYTHQQQADTLLLWQVVVKAGEGSVSLPPTTFEYQVGTSTYQLAAGVTLGLEEYLTTSKANEQWLDLDGDGLPDRVAWPNWRRNTTSPPGSAVPTFA